MQRTSITDAKNKLSALIDRVRRAETVLTCERNRQVARQERTKSLTWRQASQAGFLAFDDRLREAASRAGFVVGP